MPGFVKDIRLLGRILGDTVRDQEGADVFDLVERIRQTSIRFHRDDDKPARRELELILDSMSTSQTVRIVRAFSYFSHLANIAEDQNNIRQMRARSTPADAAPGHAAADPGACPRGRHQRRRPAQVFLGGPDQPGADRIKNVPRRAAGPDIRHVVIGNEGALCFITEVTVKLFPYLPENNTFLGWTLKSMKTGFEVLREVMAGGYKPSVARLYDPGDGGIHFSHFAAEDDCVLLFMAEGTAGIARATAEGIAEIAARHPELEPVDGELIRAWFEDLTWGLDKIAAEDERIRTTHNVNRTTEISAGWSAINDIYEAAIARIRAEIPDLTILGGHSSHSYINGTNMYFNYFYDLVDCPPEEEVTKYYLPIIAVICEETLRFGGSIVHHHGIGKARAPWAAQEYGSSYPILEALKTAFDPNGIMNKGTIIPP